MNLLQALFGSGALENADHPGTSSSEERLHVEAERRFPAPNNRFQTREQKRKTAIPFAERTGFLVPRPQDTGQAAEEPKRQMEAKK